MEFQTITAEKLLGSLNEVESKNAPRELYYRGDASLVLRRPIVSIVGSRKASIDGKRRAGFLARKLVERDVTVLSGLAEGIDTEAHLATIQAGGKTIGVIGTPLDKTFPAKNKLLQEKIATEHLLLSQFRNGTGTTKASFPQRNRTMALIADATVIVEAKDGSGSLHQGWETLRLGRTLVIMESAVQDESLTWPKEFLKYGAYILAKEEIDAFIATLVTHRSSEVIEIAF